MKCKVCGKETGKIFEAKVMNKYDVSYFFCSHCGHIQTEEPYWLDEAYESPINIEDTGILRRNLDMTVATVAVICSFYDLKAKFLDYASGYGILVRLLRDTGLDFVWEDKYTQNLFARGFEYNESDKIELITAYEVLEHLYDPMFELDRMFKISSDVLFTQHVMGNPPPSINNWFYYAPSHGQHVSFYSNNTLDYIASVFGKKHLSSGHLHLFTGRDITQEKFDETIKQSMFIYANSSTKLESKILEDMKYIVNKKAGIN